MPDVSEGDLQLLSAPGWVEAPTAAVQGLFGRSSRAARLARPVRAVSARRSDDIHPQCRSSQRERPRGCLFLRPSSPSVSGENVAMVLAPIVALGAPCDGPG